VPPPLPAGSAVARIVRAVRRPLTLPDDPHGIRGDLPHDDVEWLSASGVDLIVPVTTGEASRELLLVLGPRMSEEPYSREDIDLLAAIATSLALVERTDRPEPTGASAERTAASERGALARRYRLDRPIGEGGMGTVWEAYDTVLGRTVAVKRLKAADGPDAAVRFKREAQAAARLVHPNVVVVHDYGVDDEGHPFLVMERLRGRTLRQRFQAERRLPAPVAAALLRGAAGGVAAAHAQQLVHRDLKPENVFLSGDASQPDVKILDFGIARSLELGAATTHIATAGLAGTLLYMAPEQLAGGQPSPSWDVWALAVIAYEMLAGVRPLASSDPLICVPALLAGQLVPLRTRLPDAPPAWDAFFVRALSLDPTMRPQTPADLAHAFDEALNVSVRTASPGRETIEFH
jgi:serine/threonine protein kinase